MTVDATRGRGESGSALLVALASMGLLAMLGLALALVTTVETDVAANAHAAVQALALAEGAAERAAAELAVLPSWDPALAGLVTAAVFDGARGARRAGGGTIDLDRETAWLSCGAPACAGRPPDAMTAAQPWGRNNPQWTLYLTGTAADVLGTAGAGMPGYAAVWVGDDPGENDADPLRDGGAPVAEARSLENPGTGAIMLRAIGWGARGSRRELEWVVERADPVARTGLRLRVWREVRGTAP